MEGSAPTLQDISQSRLSLNSYPFTIFPAQFHLASVAAVFSWRFQDSKQQSLRRKNTTQTFAAKIRNDFLQCPLAVTAMAKRKSPLKITMKQPFCHLVFANSWDGLETFYSWTHVFLPSDSKSSPWVWKKSWSKPARAMCLKSLMRQPLVYLDQIQAYGAHFYQQRTQLLYWPVKELKYSKAASLAECSASCNFRTFKLDSCLIPQ